MTTAARRARRPPRSDRTVLAAFRREDARVPFGPIFFLTRLAAFVRERCPSPAEGLPVVLIHLAEGETLDLCHVVGVAPRWVALAVRAVRNEPSLEDAHRMRTVLVPYAHVVRVTMQPESLDASSLGFRQAVAPVPMDGDGSRVRAETMFHAAGGVARTAARAREAS